MEKKFYIKIAKFATNYPGWIIAAIFLFSIIPTWLIPQLELKTDYAELVSQDESYQKNFNKYLQNFGASEALFAIIDSQHAPIIADHCAQRLLEQRDHRNRPLVKKVLYRVDKKFIQKYGLLFASEKDLRTLEMDAPFLSKLSQSRDIADFIATLSQLMAESNDASQLHNDQDNLLADIIAKLRQAVTDKQVRPPDIVPKEDSAKPLLQGVDNNGYFVLPGGQLIMQIFPYSLSDDFRKLSVFLQAVKKVFADVAKDYTATISYTGSPQYTVDEMADVSRDISVVTLISTVGVSLLFIFAFRSFIWPILVIITLGIAILWTFGIAALTFGYLNIVSIVFAVVLVGLGIDFGIHLIERYSECRTGGEEHFAAMKTAVSKSGIAITTGAITTAQAFYISAFSGFRGSFQLGILGGTGILLCLAFMLIMLPALLTLVNYRYHLQACPKHGTSLLIRCIQYLGHHPHWVFYVTTATLILAGTAIFYTRFDTNLLNLQRKNSEAVRIEKELLKEHAPSGFAIILRERHQAGEIRDLIQRLGKLSTVRKDKIEAITNLLPPDQASKIARIRKIKKAFVPQRQISPEGQAPAQEKLLAALDQLQQQCSNLIDMAVSGLGVSEQWIAYLDKVQEEVGLLREVIEQRSYADIAPTIANYQQQLLSQIRRSLKKIVPYLAAQRLNLADIPENLRSHFISDSGLHAIYVYSKHNIREAEHLQKFVGEIRTVDPNATGPSIQIYEILMTMKHGYQRAGIIAIIAVFIVLIFQFSSIYIALLTILPIISGSILMVGIMYVIDIRFNPANLMSLPLIFGIGIDNSIHIMHRYFKEKENNWDIILQFTGKAILLTSATTIIGFGSLSFTTHRGMSSLGIIMSIGVVSCLYTSIVFLPSVLQTLCKKRVISAPTS